MAFIAYNPASNHHDMPGHPETARRADAILRAFDADPAIKGLPRIVPDRAIRQEEALRTHSSRLWLNLESIGPHVPAYLDPDTYVVEASFEAATGTARLSMLAAERSWSQGEPGFVVARPPGHHATHDRSMGFCLFNNVAVAANHLVGLGAKRVLVFDHDVHHGNGTQDIFYSRDDVLYQSFHLAPHYPGSGAIEEQGEGPGRGFTVNAPVPHGTDDANVRSLFQNVFLPIAKAYRPDAVLVSSGFDSLAADPLGGLEISAQGLSEMVGALRRLVPRTVCFLEGGYVLPATAAAATREVQALLRPPPSEPRVSPLPVEARLRKSLQDDWPTLA